MEKVKNFFAKKKQKILQKLRRRHVERFLILFEDFFPCEKFLDFCGFPLLRRVATRSDKYRKIHFWVCLASLVIFGLQAAISCGILTRDSSQFQAAVENFCYSCGSVMVLAKAFWGIFYNRKKILELLEKLDELFPQRCSDQQDFDVRKHLKQLKLLTWIECATFGVHVLNFVAFPLTRQVFGWLTSQTFEWELPLALLWPFDTSNSIAFWLVYISNCFIFFYMGSTFVFTDLLYASLMSLTSMQFDILAEKISEAEDAAELKKLVKVHQQLLEITNPLEEIFAPLLLVNILSMIAGQCCMAFLGVVRFF